MIAPFASGPGIRTPGDQYGWRVSPIEPAGTARTSSSKRTSGAMPRLGRPGDLAVAELALEPLDHPVARA